MEGLALAVPRGVDSSARFRQERRFRRRREEWDLAALLAVWTESEGEETWPWVWTWKNENGPHHVFVGVDGQTLEQCRRVADASPQNNLTLILQPGHPLLLADDASRRGAATNAASPGTRVALASPIFMPAGAPSWNRGLRRSISRKRC